MTDPFIRKGSRIQPVHYFSDPGTRKLEKRMFPEFFFLYITRVCIVQSSQCVPQVKHMIFVPDHPGWVFGCDNQVEVVQVEVGKFPVSVDDLHNCLLPDGNFD